MIVFPCVCLCVWQTVQDLFTRAAMKLLSGTCSSSSLIMYQKVSEHSKLFKFSLVRRLRIEAIRSKVKDIEW